MRFILSFLSVTASWNVYSHELNRYGIQPLEWRNDQITQVTTTGGVGQRINVEGRDCIAGGTLNFDVRDEYAFDIDETVWLDLELRVEPAGGKLSVSFHGHEAQSAARMGSEQFELAARPGGYWHKLSVPLERARFAGLGWGGADFALINSSDSFGIGPHAFAICGLSLRRSYTTPVVKDFGWAAIEVVDEKGRPTPARMGIYDRLGRMPMPSEEALILRNAGWASSARPLNNFLPWPVKNRSVFFTDGRYHSRLPAGEYELIVAKGPEHRLVQRRFTITAGKSQSIKVRLRRWVDMAGKGWYSGDGHIHYARENAGDDRNIQLFAQAEDLRVSNILQMGNIAASYFSHHDWQPIATGEPPFVLAPGQEDPRTGYRGHTMHLNIKQPVRDPARYLLYHEVFEKVQAQGGMAGYAHLSSGLFEIMHATTGLAMDVPFGLVDFVEIMSQGQPPDAVWFDFLNLGYKLSPVAGTDYMGYGVVGSVRNYVQVDKGLTPHGWFDSLKKGRTFVTNGPMLEMHIDGHGMGAEIHVKRGEPLSIVAQAVINPDMGSLAKVELIEQGEVVKTSASERGEPKLDLRHEFQATHGTWFVLRARGKNNDALALSAPIYVLVDDQSFWKPAEVPSIVAKLKRSMQRMLVAPELELQSEGLNEPWEARELVAEQWKSQQGALKTRVEQANAIYDDLVKRAAISVAQP